MTDANHLTWARIVSLLVDRGSTSESTRGHLADCAVCRARLGRAERAHAALPDALDPGAPDIWIARAERRSVPRGFLAPLRGPYVAQVVFDSATDLKAGIRAGIEGGRQWLLAGERIEIELHLGDPLEDAPFELSGQLFAIDGEEPGLEHCRIVLEAGGAVLESTRTEAQGTFFLRTRPAGPFRIRVEGDGWDLSTPALVP